MYLIMLLLLALTNIQADLLELKNGTQLSVELTKALTTTDQRRGNRFTATLTKPIRQNKHTLLPKGSKIHGRITDIQSIESGTSKIGLELSSINVDNHLYTLTTHRVLLECNGDLITLTEGAPAFDAHTELGDWIALSGDIHIPTQTSLTFRLAAPLYIKE
ncbi:MAG: hypothetical protein HN521_23920 [Candidatus Latescibacteria bacterium]|nr:hypothetical protein [Candidatus Latescibacterota bacterium]